MLERNYKSDKTGLDVSLVCQSVVAAGVGTGDGG